MCEKDLSLWQAFGLMFLFYLALIILLIPISWLQNKIAKRKFANRELPPLEVMETIEKNFLAWLTVLYRDNPSIVQSLFDDTNKELEEYERIGECDCEWVVAYLQSVVPDKSHCACINHWDMDWKKCHYDDWLDDELSAMWQRFHFKPNWADYRENDFICEGDELPIEPFLRFLKQQFAKYGAELFAYDDFDGFWHLFIVPIADKDDFVEMSKNWGLVDWFE